MEELGLEGGKEQLYGLVYDIFMMQLSWLYVVLIPGLVCQVVQCGLADFVPVV